MPRARCNRYHCPFSYRTPSSLLLYTHGRLASLVIRCNRSQCLILFSYNLSPTLIHYPRCTYMRQAGDLISFITLSSLTLPSFIHPPLTHPSLALSSTLPRVHIRGGQAISPRPTPGLSLWSKPRICFHGQDIQVQGEGRWHPCLWFKKWPQCSIFVDYSCVWCTTSVLARVGFCHD